VAFAWGLKRVEQSSKPSGSVFQEESSSSYKRRITAAARRFSSECELCFQEASRGKQERLRDIEESLKCRSGSLILVLDGPPSGVCSQADRSKVSCSGRQYSIHKSGDNRLALCGYARAKLFFWSPTSTETVSGVITS